MDDHWRRFPSIAGHSLISVLWTNSLIKEIHHALLFTMVSDTEDVMGDFLEVVCGAQLLRSSPLWN